MNKMNGLALAAAGSVKYLGNIFTGKKLDKIGDFYRYVTKILGITIGLQAKHHFLQKIGQNRG
jgi:hypothetical protein